MERKNKYDENNKYRKWLLNDKCMFHCLEENQNQKININNKAVQNVVNVPIFDVNFFSLSKIVWFLFLD